MCRRNRMEMNSPDNANPCCGRGGNGRGRHCGSGSGIGNFHKRCLEEAPSNMHAEMPFRLGMGFGARRGSCRMNETDYPEHMIEIIENKIKMLQDALNNLKARAKLQKEDSPDI